MKRRAYIDIETTGLSSRYAALTVVGIGIEHAHGVKLVQLVQQGLSERAILDALDGVDELYSYNGARFDLPFIRAAMGVDLKKRFSHRDLMYDCWRKKLKGGLKAVEARLGIERRLKEIDGRKAVLLWWDYVNNYNRASLKILLEYNGQDVCNLRMLREKLGVE